ncbi:hypothetical protein SPRG_18844 [Saprolegnia parasitica CBS 223.65]|uniref:Potassium channel tetramerisation-type BTB domain-containing protein n=1 Tax=Saprolegnia parasitica (strain CBS 223.65) TaxID=695850 RepID=A0A067D2J0_SAPPC|nr:hypothetical protein SPRG_18844 [Saprolegnia parasitica CBS 223.65]KDO35685.1 hypothetical protein SPRG_18844 [Saprolegnia parasitica CBS 223.65]|eukprot:XP_012194060.1 hypothetical protein SPRG_18844 [Saprolegnia parasitica CBS 223.65]
MDEIKDKYRREWEALEKEETALAQEKKKLSDEWVSIEKQQQHYEKDRAAFEKQVAAKLEFLSPDTVVHFNIGGKLFKSTVSVWARDRFSILAQLCTTQPKLGTDGRGHYFLIATGSSSSLFTPSCATRLCPRASTRSAICTTKPRSIASRSFATPLRRT